MHHVIILCTVVSIAVAASITEDSQAKTLEYENFNDGEGYYKFSFKTSNGIYREETGYVDNIGEEGEHLVVRGSYTYTDSNGKLVVVRYKADENGYQINPPKSSSSLPPISFRLSPNLVASLLGK